MVLFIDKVSNFTGSKTGHTLCNNKKLLSVLPRGKHGIYLQKGENTGIERVFITGDKVVRIITFGEVNF